MRLNWQATKLSLMKKIIESDRVPAPIGPYSQAVLSGGTLYASGQIALDAETGVMENESIETEIKKVMSNIKALLAEAGMEFSNVVKSSIFLNDLNDFDVVNRIYGGYFINQYPARETVEVARLPKDARVEISIIAIK